ncbi:MAG TPA: PEGA domain-containing protein, partial [Polyangia bacterium]
SMRGLAEALRSVERRRAAPELAGAADSTAFVRAPRRVGGVWVGLAATGIVAALAGGFFAGARNRAAAAGGGALVVTSRPNDAVVEIDGKRIAETTPTMVRGVAAGAHRVRVSAAGRAPVEQVVTVEPAARVVVDVALPASSRAVEVQSVPDGAAVFVDGVRIAGETPVTVTLTIDDFHEIRVERLGYEPETHAVKPEDRDAVVNLPLRPERQPRGMLAIESAPGDQLWIDGKNSGYLTPTLPIWVAAGEHLIELRDSTGRARSVPHIQVRQGETVHLTIGAKEDACQEKAK